MRQEGSLDNATYDQKALAWNLMNFRTKIDVKMVVQPSDFPGNEKLAEEAISALYEIYRDDALMASMTFSRGSILLQDGQQCTADLLQDFLHER